MTGMDGFALLDQVKQLCPQMIRVILSGHPDVELILRMVNERGVDRYLTKPWHGEGLKAIIQQCLELFDLRAEVKELRTLLQGKALRQETSPWVLSQRVQTTGRQLRPR
jgi:response regulator RpfG family c-di-GMP phosphodiesterase